MKAIREPIVPLLSLLLNLLVARIIVCDQSRPTIDALQETGTDNIATGHDYYTDAGCHTGHAASQRRRKRARHRHKLNPPLPP